MKKLIHNYKNAKKVIEQIKNGEWNFNNVYDGEACCTAQKDGLTLWVGSGGWYCEIKNKKAFGLLFRHWVWHAAAKHEKIKAEKKEIKLY